MEPISHLFDFLRPRPDSDAERAAAQARRRHIIDKLAGAITKRRLESPAALFLELNRPIGFLLSQTALFARPFLAFFLPPEDVTAAAEVLADQDALDELLDRLTAIERSEPN
ncbi:MAG: hypothetical protein ACE149_01495 [Armatimonadota bacterium]